MKLLKENLEVEKLKETQYTGGNICISTCGTYLFCVYGSSCNVIEISTGNTVNSLDSEEEEITCITLSPDDKHLITAHRNLLIKQWDNWRDFPALATKTHHTIKCTRTWKAIHSAPVQFMTFDSTSTLLATASSDFTTKIWDIEAQYCTHNLKGSLGIIRWARFHPMIEKYQTCVTGSEDCKLRVYNLNTSEMQACLEGHFSAVTCFEFINYDSSDTHFKYLLSASRDKVAIVWCLKTFSKLHTIPTYEGVESLFLASNLLETSLDRFFVTMGNEGVLKLWDAKKSRVIFKQNESESLKIENKRRQDVSLQQCIIQSVFVRKLNTLILVTYDQLIVFVRLNKEAIERVCNDPASKSSDLFHAYKQFIGDHGEILDAQLFSTNENLLALATNNEFVKVYDLDTWNCRLLKGHTDLVISLSVYSGKSDSNYLASSSKDSTIRLWKITKNDLGEFDYECVCVGVGHTQDIGALAFSRQNLSFLVSGSIDTTIKCWQIGPDYKLNVKFTCKAHEKDINSVCVSPNDKLIASGSSDKTIKLWDTQDGSCLAVLRGHKRGVWCVQFSPVDQLIASSSADATIKLWSLTDFSCFKTFEGHNTSVLKVNFLNNGTQLISSASDGLIKLWNIKTNECVNTFDQHEDKAWALCVSRDERRVISGGADGKLIVWKDVTGEKREEELEKRQEILLQEQELINYLKEKKWKKALGLAIQLDKPFKCYQIIKEILSQTPQVKNGEESKGKLDLEATLLKLRDDQIKSLLKYSIEWNTNTKFCHVAQTVFELIMRNYPPEFLVENGNNYEFSSKLIEQFLPYTERHSARLNKLAQQIMFIDYTWSNMKLDN